MLRPAAVEDLESTWSSPRLESVSRWLSRAPQSLAEYREHFTDPESLAKSLVIEHDGEVIRDLMVAVGDAWSEAELAEPARGVQADLGWTIHPDAGGGGLATEAVREV